MNWLIWREYRQNRVLLIAGTVLMLLPYVVSIIGTVYWYAWANAPNHERLPVATAFGFAAFYSIVFSQLTIALLGGNAIAGERADRSAQFIAFLPLPRSRRLASKAILALAVAVVVWGANALVIAIAASTAGRLPSEMSGAGVLLTVGYFVAITGVTFYSVGWLISSFQSSPTFAAGAGLVTPLLLLACLYAAVWFIGVDTTAQEQIVGRAYAVICPILAVASFSLGTWYFLRRVEP